MYLQNLEEPVCFQDLEKRVTCLDIVRYTTKHQSDRNSHPGGLCQSSRMYCSGSFEGAVWWEFAGTIWKGVASRVSVSQSDCRVVFCLLVYEKADHSCIVDIKVNKF